MEIFAFGIIMIIDNFGVHIPSYVSLIITFSVVGIFFYKSKFELSKLKGDFSSAIKNPKK